MSLIAITIAITPAPIPEGTPRTYIADVYRHVKQPKLPPAPRSVTHNMTALKDKNRATIRALMPKISPTNNATLAKKAQVSPSTARAIVQEFETAGLIWIDRTQWPWQINWLEPTADRKERS